MPELCGERRYRGSVEEPGAKSLTETQSFLRIVASYVHYVYVLACSDDTYYTGYTTDVDRRVAEHDAGDGAKYTRGRTPVTLQYVERFESQSTAMSREYDVKQLTRAQKDALVATQNDPWAAVEAAE